MVSDWCEYRLGELAEIYDGPHATPSKTEDGPIFLGISNLNGGRLDLSNTEHLSEDDYQKWTRRVTPQTNDIVFSYETRLGEAALIPAGLKCCLGRRIGLLRPIRELVDSRFLLYAYLSQDFQETLRAHTIHGSTVDRIPLIDMPKFPISVPCDIQEQRAIAHILGTLDDKIELNRQMNATLEAMARAIFKSWFVDFDPVRAKAEGRDTGLPKEIADLFPDSFEETELGEVPKGWRLSNIGSESKTVLGGTPSRNEETYWGGNIPWINSGKANEFRILEPSEFITKKGLDSSATKRLPPRTTVIAITGATLGQVSLTEIETCANQSIIGVLGTEALPSEFIYFWTKENIENLLACQTGGAQQHINKSNVNDLPVLCPRDKVISAFLTLVFPLFDRIKTCCMESLTLAELRDTLLPKLISGELRGNEAEKLVRCET